MYIFLIEKRIPLNQLLSLSILIYNALLFNIGNGFSILRNGNCSIKTIHERNTIIFDTESSYEDMAASPAPNIISFNNLSAHWFYLCIAKRLALPN
ncbi:hypothetical protein NTGM5_670013 [Candidatus Nitrotoga sp. M5]|nr:hypothetical protein NTGM5_670013 [Candidatus Nitrotoga sp. M5]